MLIASASASASPRLTPLRLAPLEDPKGALSAADSSRLSQRLSALLGERYQILPPCNTASCLAIKGARLVARVVVDEAATGPRCRLRLLLIAPPLLPRRVESGDAACRAATLAAPLTAAVKELLPSAVGQAEAASRPTPRGRRRASRKRRLEAAPRRREARKYPSSPPFRDRFRMSVGALVVHRQRELGANSASKVGLGIQGTVEVFPFVGRRRDWLADLGLELRYARLLKTEALGAYDWLEALLRIRWNVQRRSGGPELALAVGWGMQALHGSESGIPSISGEPFYAHNLTAQLRGWLPFARRRAWWLGLRAEASLLWVLPAVDVEQSTTAAMVSVGPEFSYRGMSGRLELLYRRVFFDLSGADPRVGERVLGGLFSLHYAL